MADDLDRIRKIHGDLAKSRSVYDFQPPAMISHAADYAEQPERLRKYATTVVNARIMQLLGITFMKTWHFLDAYLFGIERKNPFAALGAARSQIEVYAVTWDAMETVRSLSTDKKIAMVERVVGVDAALIMATYGTRSALIKEMFLQEKGVSKLRSANAEDVKMIEAKNVLTCIDRLSRTGAYSECRASYDRLCEYLHPNIGQNIILMSRSPLLQDFVRIERSGDQAVQHTVAASAKAMADTTERTIAILEGLRPPFG